MNVWIKKLAMAGAIAATGLMVGCQDRNREADVEMREGTGGAGVGDSDIGKRDGVLNDGEGPLEENHDERMKDTDRQDTIGDKPGVINDGEGPIEENRNPNTRSGEREGVLDDGEGPIEENRDLNQ